MCVQQQQPVCAHGSVSVGWNLSRPLRARDGGGDHGLSLSLSRAQASEEVSRLCAERRADVYTYIGTHTRIQSPPLCFIYIYIHIQRIMYCIRSIDVSDLGSISPPPPVSLFPYVVCIIRTCPRLK